MSFPTAAEQLEGEYVFVVQLSVRHVHSNVRISLLDLDFANNARFIQDI
jgi:hypothetical protein